MVSELSDLCDEVPATGMRAAIADISPVWLSTVILRRSEDRWTVVSGMLPELVKSWIRHFRNWTIISEEEEGGERMRQDDQYRSIQLHSAPFSLKPKL